MRNKYFYLDSCKDSVEVVEIETDERGVTVAGMDRIRSLIKGWVQGVTLGEFEGKNVYALVDEEFLLKGGKPSMSINGFQIGGSAVFCTEKFSEVDGVKEREFCGFDSDKLQDAKCFIMRNVEGIVV